VLGALAGAGAPRKNAESTRDLMVDEHMSCESDVTVATHACHNKPLAAELRQSIRNNAGCNHKCPCSIVDIMFVVSTLWASC